MRDQFPADMSRRRFVESVAKTYFGVNLLQAASNAFAAPPLKGAKALSSTSGEMRLLLADGERTLHPGDRLGTDVVRTVGDGVLVLDRPQVASRPGGSAVVVVRFDAAGEPRMRVYHVEDPTPVTAPEVH